MATTHELFRSSQFQQQVFEMQMLIRHQDNPSLLISDVQDQVAHLLNFINQLQVFATTSSNADKIISESLLFQRLKYGQRFDCTDDPVDDHQYRRWMNTTREFLAFLRLKIDDTNDLRLACTALEEVKACLDQIESAGLHRSLTLAQLYNSI